MNLYFAEVPKQYIDEMDYFIDPKSQKPYYLKLVVDDEENSEGTLVIEDTIGRFMPLDFSQLDELIEVLQVIQKYRHDKASFINRWKQIFGV
jgi:hypothetical protein